MKKNKAPSNFAAKFWIIWLAALVLSGVVRVVSFALSGIPGLSNFCSVVSNIAGATAVFTLGSSLGYALLVFLWIVFIKDGKLVWERVFVAAVVILIAILLVNVPSERKPVESTENTYYVYITDTGEKYHRAGCPYLSQSKHMISLETARQRGYTACSRCW